MEQIYRARSNNCGKNLLASAIESKNWVVHARLNTAINAEDAEAADLHYHSSCYTKLKNALRAAKSQSSDGTQTSANLQAYDPLVFAHLIAYVRISQSPIKLSELRKLCEQRLKTLASDWIRVNIHPTRFKEHLLNKLGPDWAAFQQGREVYISNKETVGTALAETARLQVTDEEAQKIVDVGLMLRKYVVIQQLPFDGSFHPNCLSEPVDNPLLTLIDIMLEGSRSIRTSGTYEGKLRGVSRDLNNFCLSICVSEVMTFLIFLSLQGIMSLIYSASYGTKIQSGGQLYFLWSWHPV